jgi:type II secretory pathway pseudopilin PulG
MKIHRDHFYPAQSAFTMVEIALSLAVIGIALLAIIRVLPIGMNVQQDNREETIIDQDATVFMEAIRNYNAGSTNESDLTNYVYAITNFQTYYNPAPGTPVANGYNSSYFTNNARIIGLLSTPEYTDNQGDLIANPPLFNSSYYSNHVVAYVRSISGPAMEKPPQDNRILQRDSFGYKIIFENVPVAVPWPDVNSTSFTSNYDANLIGNLHELRLTFLWPLLPNGNTGAGRQTFRTLVGGQIIYTNDTSVTPNQPLYFLQSQSFNITAP